MSKIRDDLRAAFSKEQEALGDVSDARHRLVRQALVQREAPGSNGLQWAAGVAAVLIAVIVVTTFVLAKANNHSHVVPAATPTPKAQVSPTPLSQQLSVPDSTPVILYHDPASFDQIDGMTWDGKVSGKVGDGGAKGGVGNPQGTYYATDHDIRNRSGSVVQTFDITVSQPFWADDGVHYCDATRTASRDVSAPGMLQFGTIGQAPHNVAKVGSFAAANLQGGGPVVVACSPTADRAVVYQAPPGGVGVVNFAVIQLSTGHTLWTGGSGAWISASHDGRYVAVSPAPGQPTKIYGDGGSVVGSTSDEVFAFSWDGSLAVVAGSFGSVPSIVDWRIGKTTWTSPNNQFRYWQAFPEPGGSHIAIGVTEPAYKNTNGFQPVDLFVVGPGGAITLQRNDLILFS